MTHAPAFPRIVYTAAGVYGLFVMLPQYWMEIRIGRDTPPAITHAEYFYGFIGVAVAWQVAFLLIARAPELMRGLIPVTVVEKVAFGVPAIILYAQHRLDTTVLGFGIVDLVWAMLFMACGLVVNSRSGRESRVTTWNQATDR